VSWPSREARLASFDGGVSADSRVMRPDRYRFWDAFPPDASFIPRGAGYSYAAASFGAGALAIEHGAFDRILGFDEATGRVKVEAGITLGALYRFLAQRGWFLPVQPGFPGITVGGCIAPDCHGKNQRRDGCFSTQVVALEIFHPDHGVVEASREAEAHVLELTCGGFGLTGCILTAVLQARRLVGRSVALRTEALHDVRGLVGALESRVDEADFVYSWHDFNAGPRAPGMVVSGTIEAGGQDGADTPAGARELRWDTRGNLPLALWGPISARLATSFYRRLSTRGELSTASVFDSMFPMATKGVPYFRFFGAPGFHEFQALVAPERFPEFCDAVLDRVGREGVPVTLASSKLFRGSGRFLRFCATGVCFALNYPRSPRWDGFTTFLDALVPRLGLVPNVIKDSRLPLQVVRAAYPEYDAFRAALREYDPRRRCRSELSARLDL
jgi:decaprenylphospho-beta-D-ribofuranose 2-oxidase